MFLFFPHVREFSGIHDGILARDMFTIDVYNGSWERLEVYAEIDPVCQKPVIFHHMGLVSMQIFADVESAGWFPYLIFPHSSSVNQ